jgi:hypothetical protein
VIGSKDKRQFMRSAWVNLSVIPSIGICAAIALAGCDIGGGLPVGPSAVESDVGEFALGKDSELLDFKLGDALLGVIPLCEVAAAVDFDAIFREEVDGSVGDMVRVTEVILTSIVLSFPNGLPVGAETLTLLAIPAESGFSSIGAPRQIGSADLRGAANNPIEIFAESEFDLLPLIESGEDEDGGSSPLLLIVLDPFTSGETIVFGALLNADAYGEISLGLMGNTALNLSGAAN